jgi:hypothetical protein
MKKNGHIHPERRYLQIFQIVKFRKRLNTFRAAKH